MNSDVKVFTEIADRYQWSNVYYGVSGEDFGTALSEIGGNEKTLARLRHLKATGAEMTIVSVNDAEIVLIDTVDDIDVEAQETFLSELPQQERTDAISNLRKRFPAIGQLLRRSNSTSGLNYYDYLLICEVTGAEPISEDEYGVLWEYKPVDRHTICWLLTEQKKLDRGVALRGDHFVRVRAANAVGRYSIQAGRPRLRVQRA